MKITVAGMGYVGMSNAILLAQNNDVIAYDVLQEKVDLINKKQSPIKDIDIDRFFQSKNLRLKATTSKLKAFENPDFVIISTPTNFNEENNIFDTHLVEQIVKDTLENVPQATIIIKSTIPVGFTVSLRKKYSMDHIYFSPEFLREGKALHDNLYPSRIIVGGYSEFAKTYGRIMLEASIKKNTEVLFTDSTEAEAIKLFANTYLAMRVAYFNEVDTFSELRGLSSIDIIKGISLDPRIGFDYNNPSFGYGGYCLPKDSKQLLSSFSEIPQNLIEATVQSNSTRKRHILNQIVKKKPEIVGVYRLLMKSDSDNFRESAINSIIKELLIHKIKVIIYEPNLSASKYLGCDNIKDFDSFINNSSLVIANRIDSRIKSADINVYSRDLFNKN
jgi:UDPglucose 6-dehydrogenase